MKSDQLKGLPVTVLLGGKSAERDVSLQSGAAVASALEALGARVTRLDPAEPYWWRQLDGTGLVFIALHGPGGEDGEVQGLLQSLELDYTGSGVLASALSMDKSRCKRLWQGMGLPTQPFVELDGGSDWHEIMDTLGAAFVKPATGGSSIGTHGVADAAELEAAWQDASRYGPVIAEKLIRGPEYTVSILGDEVLPAIRIETDSVFYDYDAKYLSDDTRYLIPCGLDDAEEAELSDLAMTAFRSLDCRVWGRVDFMRDVDDRFYLLEVNTVPGMTGVWLDPRGRLLRRWRRRHGASALMNWWAGSPA